MQILEAYRQRDLVDQLVTALHREARQAYTLMEVCGGHTMAIHRYGIPSLLPQGVRLLSGPGCPVCVTSRSYIDQAIAFTSLPGVIITTYGDLLRVPGSHGSLEQARAGGKRVEIVYSPTEAIRIAVENPREKVIFLAIGFETTAPGNAIALLEARQKRLKNFFQFSAQKVMPPAMQAVVEGGSEVQGFICPGHVSTITGTRMYEFLPRDHGIACVVSGFEPVDILLSILMLIRQINEGRPAVENQYKRAVKPEGNMKAQRMMQEVYDYSDDWWRGFGIIPGSGLQPKPGWSPWDAVKEFCYEAQISDSPDGCICGEILKGRKTPLDCLLFGKTCTPANPHGACMVSSEGACAAYFTYQGHE